LCFVFHSLLFCNAKLHHTIQTTKLSCNYFLKNQTYYLLLINKKNIAKYLAVSAIVGYFAAKNNMENFTINQKLILDYSLNLTQYSVLWAVCRSFADAEPTCVIEGRKYYALNYTKIVEFCAAAQISSSSAPKIVEFLVSRGLLDKKKCSRKFVFTELCKFAKFATNEYEIILVDCSNSIILDNDLVTTEPSNTIITSYNSITINNAPARIYSETNQSSEVFNNTKGEFCKMQSWRKKQICKVQQNSRPKVLFTLWDEVSKREVRCNLA
jgi:hypothetical protein